MYSATSKRAKPGFASEIAEFHPDKILQDTREEFKAATIAKARSSGATDEQVAAIEFYQDIEVDSVTKEVTRCPLEEFGFPYVRFGRSATQPRFFAVYRDEFSGKIFQVRTSWQRWDRKKGKYGKPYLFQTGANPIYTTLPEDPTAPKYHVITEGKDKACFLAAHGYTATSLTGAFGGYFTKDVEGKPCSPRLNPVVLERLEAVGKDKTIALWFDQDSKIETKFKVDKGITTFATLLEAEGFKVKIVSHDEAEGKGVDDAGMAQPEEERSEWVKARIKEALKFEDWKRDRRKIRFLNYLKRVNANQVAPERETEGGYLPQIPDLRPKALHFLECDKGGGKTTEIKRIVRAEEQGYTVIFAPSISVGRAIAKSLKVPHLGDCDKSKPEKIISFWQEVHRCRVIVLCIDSIDALTDCETLMRNLGLVVFDEVNQAISNLAMGGTTKDQQGRVTESLGAMLKQVIERGGSILSAEATINQRSINFLKTLSSSSDVRLFRHKRLGDFSPNTELMQGSLSGYVARLAQALLGDAETTGKKIFLPVTIQVIGEKIHLYLESFCAAVGKPLNIVRVDSKTNCLGHFNKLFGDPNEWIEEHRPDLLIGSPSIPSGVSFDEKYDYFDEVWGVFTAHTPDMWAQMQARVRADVPRKLFIKPFIQSHDTYERFCSERGVTRFLEANKKGFAKVHNIDLESLMGSDDAARRLELESAVNDFLAVEFTSLGCQKQVAKDWFKHLLTEDKHKITEAKCEKDAQVQLCFEALQEELEQEKALLCSDLEEDEPDEHGNVRAKLRSPHLRAKHYRERFDDDSDDPKTYCPPWIQNLIHFKLKCIENAPGIDFDDREICYRHLAHENARQWRGAQLQAMSEHIAASQNIERKQVEAILTGRIILSHRLPKKAMQAKLIELCGVSTLLNKVEYHNKDPRAIAIKAKALKWKKEIREWLVLDIKDTQTPVEICNKFLVKLRLDAEVVSRPGTTGKRDRIYWVPGLDDPYRNDLLEAMRLRLEEVERMEASVIDGLAMVREAGDDPDTLRVIWELLQALPEPYREEIRKRLTEHERQKILGLEAAIAA